MERTFFPDLIFYLDAIQCLHSRPFFFCLCICSLAVTLHGEVSGELHSDSVVQRVPGDSYWRKQRTRTWLIVAQSRRYTNATARELVG